ncbi:MAG: tetratricopeptide repeat protein, partial [Gammaproteobacteria bacterium]|nr:tetratricopeptide repeat protein [Gammaproteobacteria bacterium]
MTPEEERLDQVKQWWKEYRWTVIGGVSAGVIGVGGWTGWNEYTRVQQELASALFQELSVAVVQADVTGARRAFDELFEDYSGTAYAEKARLLFARAAYEVGEEADARRLLEDAVDLSSDESTAHTARIRLAQLLIQSAQYQEALDLLGSVDPG